MLRELYWGLPSRSYVRSRAWSGADLDAAEARLEERGLMADHALTDLGREARESVELVTDVALLLPWGAAIRDAAGYPASGPHDLADLAR